MVPDWTPNTDALADAFERTRRTSLEICEPLEREDYVVQSMTEASPAKWHLAHSTWFFERFILNAELGHDLLHPEFNYLFNSYYNAAGDQWTRSQRGLLSRPTVDQIEAYRADVDSVMNDLIVSRAKDDPELARLVELGIHHEQQHQELMVTDTKHMFAQNPLHPQVISAPESSGRRSSTPSLEWLDLDGGTYEIGWGGGGFAYDNEKPRHEVLLRDVRIANRPVTCGDWIEFIEDGGYEDDRLWLSDGWAKRQELGWSSPGYWVNRDGDWHLYTWWGLQPVDPAEPVCHISYYEADAFANWAGARLPTEAEWEIASRRADVESGRYLDVDRRHPTPTRPAGDADTPIQMFGDVWEWTSSSYGPYPGFEAWEGMVGEYNGKFMCNQMVLRGGSCATPPGHIRRTYRNFFYPKARWQYAGLRLAKD